MYAFETVKRIKKTEKKTMARTATKSATENTDGNKEKVETLPAKIKRLIMSLASEIKENGEPAGDTVELLNEVAGELVQAGVRGIPFAIQLENAQNLRNEIYKRAGVQDGVFAFASPEDEALNETLTVKIRNLKHSIAKEKEVKAEPETETEKES